MDNEPYGYTSLANSSVDNNNIWPLDFWPNATTGTKSAYNNLIEK